MMQDERLSALSEGQKACLRLVNEHHTSKEIARILAISPFTVDQRLDAARRKLRAETRKDAARIFAALEENISERLIYQSPTVDGEDESNIPVSPPGPVVQGEKQHVSKEPEHLSTLSAPPIGGQRHSLSAREILLQSLYIAFFSTLVIAVIVLILSGIMQLFA